jgi:hypothetical protein
MTSAVTTLGYLAFIVFISTITGCVTNQPANQAPNVSMQYEELLSEQVAPFTAPAGKPSNVGGGGSPAMGPIPTYNPSDPNSPSDINCKTKLTPTAIALAFDSQGKIIPGPMHAYLLDRSGQIQIDPATGHARRVPMGVAGQGPNKAPLVGPVMVVAILRYDRNGTPILKRPLQPTVGMLMYYTDSKGINGARLNPDRIAVALPIRLVMAYLPGGPILKETGEPLLDSQGIPVVGKLYLGPKNDVPPEKASVVHDLGLYNVPTRLDAEVPPINNRYCHPLSPLTRLVLENAGFSATGGYSNSAGNGNGLFQGTSSNTLITTATDNYAVGVGYTSKPILKQLRALAYPATGREPIANQGTPAEDLFWNAVTLNAAISYGRQLQVKGGTVTDSFNTRPFYSVSATYALDLERLYVYLAHPDTRPVDQGYYFGPTKTGFFLDPKSADPNQDWNFPRSRDYSWPDERLNGDFGLSE